MTHPRPLPHMAGGSRYGWAAVLNDTCGTWVPAGSRL